VPIVSSPVGRQQTVIRVVAAVIEVDDEFLVTRRPQGSYLAGLWEFPGGKVDAGETHAQALVRELREELGVEVEVGTLLFESSHAYADRTIGLSFYRCRLQGRPRPLLGQQMRWVARLDLGGLDFPPADDDLVKRLIGADARQP
jgi:8-oxo-dGTP diphosphatase